MTIPPNTMTDLLKIVLEQNYFQIADKMYHHVQGTAMGTKMAPSYANLFMAELEEKLLANYPIKPILWKRYIDDILCIWPGPPSELDRFMKYLNQSHPTIKFTHEIHPRKFYTQCGFPRLNHLQSLRYTTSLILDIAQFFKSTNKFQYLEYSSAHPIGTFTSLTTEDCRLVGTNLRREFAHARNFQFKIPTKSERMRGFSSQICANQPANLCKGELTRLLRACSDQETYKKSRTNSS